MVEADMVEAGPVEADTIKAVSRTLVARKMDMFLFLLLIHIDGHSLVLI